MTGLERNGGYTGDRHGAASPLFRGDPTRRTRLKWRKALREHSFDIVLYGATGYTGRLVAGHLLSAYGDSDLRIALAGRSERKLRDAFDQASSAGRVSLLEVEASDQASLRDVAKRTRMLMSVAGPYGQVGEGLVAAAVEAGCCYLDLCGELPWMRRMLARYEQAAQASGSLVMFSCGFDSIPSSLGVHGLQEAATRRFGKPFAEVSARVSISRGGLSGGTVASLRAGYEEDAAALADAYILTPGFRGPSQPDDTTPRREHDGMWLAPFVMAPINSANIHRSNYELDFFYGRDFRYREMLEVGTGEVGEAAARAIAEGGLALLPTLAPGDGPTREDRETGSYRISLQGESAEGVLTYEVNGAGDPGYGSTSRIAVETAMCALEAAPRGGFWTPAALLGSKLRDRLSARAMLSFDLV